MRRLRRGSLAIDAPRSRFAPQRTVTLTENCLTLNIWTPTYPHLHGASLPVMVWFHGGGFTDGASDHDNGYDGTALATLGNVIVVTVNHRLGVFGFLACRPSTPRTKITNPAITDSRTSSWRCDGCETTPRPSAATRPG